MNALPALRIPRGFANVRADVSNPAQVLAEMKRAFEAFKTERDDELKAIKAGLADVVTADKVERINAELSALQATLDDMNATIAAIRVGGAGDVVDADVTAHATAFNAWFRRGDRALDADMRGLEVQANLTTQSDPDGGYLVPEEMAAGIDRIVSTVSVLRALSTNLTISTDTYKKLVGMGGAGGGWVGETDARPETDTPVLRELVFNMQELYANPAATQAILDDGRVNIGQWMANEVAITFAEMEGAAFINGDGVNKPRGLMSYTPVANASYSWGKMGFTATGVAAALTDGSNNGADAMIGLYYALKSQYRNGSTWLMSDLTMGLVRKFKSNDGAYLWAPPTQPGEIATFLGKPVRTDDNMAAVEAGAFPIAFGNLARAYLVLDRFGIRVLRDPFTNKPYVHFYTTKRVGGGVQNFEAFKALKVAA